MKENDAGSDKNSFTRQILPWFYQNKRDLPFRHSKDPYQIWISEIMAQQTQIDTLIPYYERFIALFPTVKDLAEARESDVLKAWEGLGYYSRAKNLHKTAKMIHEEYADSFPSDFKTGLTLPGIGPYTGGAIYSIAFRQPVAAVDGNVLRVVCRYNNWPDDIGLNTTKKKVENWVLSAQPENAPGDFNESLMELGALICTPKNPKCEQCPLKAHCESYRKKTVDEIPFKLKKTKQTVHLIAVALIRRRDRYCLVKRPEKGLLGGMWGFPMIEYDSGNRAPEKALITELFLPKAASEIRAEYIGKTKHVFTHRIWEMNVYMVELQDDFDPDLLNLPEQCIFETMPEIKKHYALPVAFSKITDLLEEQTERK